MRKYGFGMGKPGYTLTISASPEDAGRVIADTFVTDGFLYKSAPGAFPINLTYSSMGTSVCIEWFSQIVPIILAPSLFRKTLPMKVRIRVLDHSVGPSTLRVDMYTYDSTVLALPFFDKVLNRAVATLIDQGVRVEVGPLTDSMREKRERRNKR